MIELERVERRYGDVVAVRDVSLSVAAGELVALLGGSGSGKTTTLKMVNRLIEPTAGRVCVGGRDVASVPGPELRRRIGYCFQQAGLFPHLSVARNVGVTPELCGWDPERISRRVDALLEQVELDPAVYRARMPAQLSGGEQQRVGLARALAAEPEVLLMDEPFGALDPLTRDLLQERFDGLRRRLSVTTLFVTHDVAEALRLADRIAVLDAGSLVQLATPRELLLSPAGPAVARMVATPRRQAETVDALLAPERR